MRKLRLSIESHAHVPSPDCIFKAVFLFTCMRHSKHFMSALAVFKQRKNDESIPNVIFCHRWNTGIE